MNEQMPERDRRTLAEGDAAKLVSLMWDKYRAKWPSYRTSYQEGFLDALDEAEQRLRAQASDEPSGAERAEPRINYLVLQEFAHKHRLSYNELCTAVREALSAPPPPDAEAPAGAGVPLSEGAVMGAYMEFDRTADRSWSSSEYLVKYGMWISQRTVAASPQSTAGEAQAGTEGGR